MKYLKIPIVLIFISTSLFTNNQFDYILPKSETSSWKLYYDIPIYFVIGLLGMVLYEDRDNWKTLNLSIENEYPLVDFLSSVPNYEMIGNIIEEEHESNVKMGFLVGLISSYISYKNKTPFVLKLTRDSVVVGFKYKF